MNLSFGFRWATRRRPAFVNPMPGAARAVIFEPLFRKSASILYVDPNASDAATRLVSFQPAVIAGRAEQLLRLADTSTVTHAIVVFTSEGQRCLNDTERDYLWQAYRVPVFEQIIGSDGRLVAWECEAHEGLHLCDGAQSTADRVVVGVCDCGSAATRVIGPSIAPARAGGEDLPTLLLSRRTESPTRPLPM